MQGVALFGGKGEKGQGKGEEKEVRKGERVSLGCVRPRPFLPLFSFID
jgi:hypothetical protein